MADRIIAGNEIEIVRFACDCGSQAHSLDFCIERNEEGEVVYCSMSPYLAGKASFSWRVKTAWRNLRGLDGYLGDFIVRPEDYAEFVKLGAELTISPNTSHT